MPKTTSLKKGANRAAKSAGNSKITRQARSGKGASSKSQQNIPQDSSVSRLSKNQGSIANLAEKNKTNNDGGERINSNVGALMIATAIGIDILEIILALTGVGEAVNYGLDVAKIIGIPLVFALQGVSPAQPGRLLRLGAMFIVGLIPYVGSIVPEVAIGVIATINHSRKEDKKG